ncbi:MAG: hypothetical protein V4671_23805 [Armatimonadota bacterium]
MNTNHFLNSAVSLVMLASLSAAPVAAQTKKPAAKKPVSAKPAAAKAAGPVVLGTTQLPGDFGKLGTTYTVGTREPINFTLRSAEYSATPYTIDGNTWVPRADQKLLILHYTLHNPVQREQPVSWSSLRFTAVDAQDKNQEMIDAVGRDGTSDRLSVILKPAQKIDAVAAVLVPAEGVVPKLIVEREKGAPVVRFDLRGKVKPLTAPIADASDSSGVTARKEVPAVKGTFYATGVFDTRLDEVAYVKGPLLNREAGAGKRYFTAVLTLKNRTNRPQTYYWGYFLADLKDADGEKTATAQALLKATRDEANSGEIAPGEEARIRYFFPIPDNVTGKTLRFAEGKQIDARVARVFAFDVSGEAVAAK